MIQPFYSIIIPCYNYGHLLKRAIDSIQNQGFTNWEILIIDDGSTDNSAQVAKQYAAESSKIHYLFQQNNGPATARNLGIKKCKGNFLIFLDADDTLASGTLISAHQILSDNQKIECLIGAHTSIFSNDSTKLNPAPVLPKNLDQRLIAYLEKRIAVCNGAMIIASHVFDTIQFPKELRSCEDIPVFAKILHTKHCLSTETIFVHVYKHAGSLRHNHLSAEKFRVMAVEKIFSDDLPASLQKSKRKYLSKAYLSLFRSQYLASQHQSGRRTYLKAISLYPLHILRASYFSKLKFHGNYYTAMRSNVATRELMIDF